MLVKHFLDKKNHFNFGYVQTNAEKFFICYFVGLKWQFFQYYTVQKHRKLSSILDFIIRQILISYRTKIFLYRAKILFLPSKNSFLIEQSSIVKKLRQKIKLLKNKFRANKIFFNGNAIQARL